MQIRQMVVLAALAAAALGGTATAPAQAEGGCGPYAHRGWDGRCRPGGRWGGPDGRWGGPGGRWEGRGGHWGDAGGRWGGPRAVYGDGYGRRDDDGPHGPWGGPRRDWDDDHGRW